MLAVYALNEIAKKRFGKLFDACTPEEQEIVLGAFRFGNFNSESMNIKEIAYKLMSLRESMSAFIMSGNLRESLGFEGYGEALARRWIVPDQEGSGMIQVSNHLGTVAEMRQLAEEYIAEEECTFCHKIGGECKCQKCPDCKKANCTCESLGEGKGNVLPWTTQTKGSETFHYDDKGKRRKGPAPKEAPAKKAPVEPSGETEFFTRKDWKVDRPVSARESTHNAATAHAFRPSLTLTEIATMGLGNPDRLGTPPAQPSVSQPPQPTAQPTTASPAHTQPVNVGSNVRVVQDGKTYVGRISAVKSDGKFSISFGDEKPAVLRDYDKTEVTPVADAVTK